VAPSFPPPALQSARSSLDSVVVLQLPFLQGPQKFLLIMPSIGLARKPWFPRSRSALLT
jgi:hypothetical protein